MKYKKRKKVEYHRYSTFSLEVRGGVEPPWLVLQTRD